MIALNWFEVLLPPDNLRIQEEVFPASIDLPAAVRTLKHRTIIRRNGDQAIRYHITSNAVEGSRIAKIPLEGDSGLVRVTLEHGFGLCMAAAGFSVRTKKVGGSGYRDTGLSLHPDVYRTLEGIRFRAFFFPGDSIDKAVRWGLVLNYVSGQRFAISLANDQFAQIAMGRHVVPRAVAESDEDSAVTEGGARLVDLHGNQAILESPDGQRMTVSRSDWTLPGNKRYVLSAAERFFGPKSAQAVSLELQRNALTLTTDHRMNTALARSQYERLRGLLHEFHLLSFKLPLPDTPAARIMDRPLAIP